MVVAVDVKFSIDNVTAPPGHGAWEYAGAVNNKRNKPTKPNPRFLILKILVFILLNLLMG